MNEQNDKKRKRGANKARRFFLPLTWEATSAEKQFLSAKIFQKSAARRKKSVENNSKSAERVTTAAATSKDLFLENSRSKHEFRSKIKKNKLSFE
ncbi:hypothetical protein BpJC7_16480 [Weizmannia acidilactici]|uniref:Uncharacterized protein n=1 Tax=Weizmannia acidilactici TaxID=2607726 RepID=A0A5J4JI33_9BACI|nr:hypothetical protein [Weizmannia acidilactici]GER70345.1 hypothetical protein BpJC7_16480 [Weizmannia acidilactici]GER73590.1 hypothetical protein BpPP18_16570 [Weizmannia acidilactici]